MLRRLLASFVGALLIAGLIQPAGVGAPAKGAGEGGAKDAVVVAVIDSGLSPYHWDYLGSKMPQHLDADAGNDLPLNRPPHEWLPGFPSPSKSFDSYNRLDLTLDDANPDRALIELDTIDKPKWDAVKQSTTESLNYYWMPDTKVIGALDFSGSKIHGRSNTHGMGTSSVSVGNIHGTCPECLLLFITYSNESNGEAAIEWAMDQPWIDAISNSYGFSLVNRDRFYSGSDVEAQRAASKRGQTIFFSAGNGQENAFAIPNTTLFSSQEGPDWIVTVGAVSPQVDEPIENMPGSHASYTGAGKPADIAGIGGDYPASYYADTVSETGATGFGGTSNATPTIAGTYARGLYLARTAMSGMSRTQNGGIVSVGQAKCGTARSNCEVGDGKLTAVELRRRLFQGAVHTPAGMTATSNEGGETPPIGEDEFLNEGHGTYFARETQDDKAWLDEFQRFIAPMFGRRKTLDRPPGEKAWFIVDSFCRQHLWGNWKLGYYVEDKTELPGFDAAWPVRSFIEETCPAYTTPP